MFHNANFQSANEANTDCAEEGGGFSMEDDIIQKKMNSTECVRKCVCAQYDLLKAKYILIKSKFY